MLRSSYVDVLLVTALKEERFVLHQLLGLDDSDQPGPLSPPGNFSERVTIRDQHNVSAIHFGAGDLHIALANLSGMGTLWAVADTIELLRRYCPRCVMLVGVAGGASSEWERRGDVCYSVDVRYSTYGKVEEEPLRKVLEQHWPGQSAESRESPLVILAEDNPVHQQIGDLPIVKMKARKTRKLDAWHSFVNACDIVAEEEKKKWQEIAHKYTDSGEVKEGFRKYVRRHHPKEDHGEQENLSQEGPIAARAIVGSGDFVVASTAFQASIKEALEESDRDKGIAAVSVFEMESFGVADACRLHGVGFGMVKGISDFADPHDKGTQNAIATGAEGERALNDGHRNGVHKPKAPYRLAAISSASAFAWCVIHNSSFAEAVKAKKRSFPSLAVPCFWATHPSQPCSTKPVMDCVETLVCARDCTVVTSRKQPDLFKPTPAARVFEGIDPDAYSGLIEEYLTVASQSSNGDAVVFIFPYTPDELTRFLEKHGDPLDAKVKAFHEAIKGEAKQGRTRKSHRQLPSTVQETIRALARHVTVTWPHFACANQWCHDLFNDGHGFYDIACRVCRIIVLPKRLRMTWGGSNGIRAILYPALLGIWVPTFVTYDEKPSGALRQYFITDEATVVLNGDAAKPFIAAYRHLNGSDSLVLLGKCQDSPAAANDPKILREVEGIFAKLHDARSGKDVPFFQDQLRRFPCWQLSEIWGKDFWTACGVDYDKVDGAALERYFKNANAPELDLPGIH